MAKATKWEDVKADLRAKGRFDDEKVQANMERLRSEIPHAPTHRDPRGIGASPNNFLPSRIGISQSRVSQIERGELEHTEVATPVALPRARRRGRGGRPTRRRTFTDRLDTRGQLGLVP